MTGVGRSLQVGRVFRVVVLLALGLAALPSVTTYAQAAPTDAAAQARDQEARRLFEAGRAAYVEENYRDALNYFQEAHELSGRPQLLFNVGQAADRLGQREQAAQAFRDYLAAVPDAGNRAEVEARIAQLEAPASADVEADAGLIGEQESDVPARDGFYLRGGLGLGAFADAFTFMLDADGKASGVALSGEVAVGAAILPGLALAGVLAAEGTQAPIAESETGKVGPLLILGGMADFYLWMERGWHLQGGFGFTHLTVAGGDSGFADHTGVGMALFGGGGHEWHIRDKLAIGVLGRITLAQAKGDEHTHNILALSVLVSATVF